MAIQKYPSRTEPFVSQKSPKGRRGPGFGIGAIVFVIVLLGIFLVVLYAIAPLMEDVVLPDIGIPYSTLFLIFIGCVILVIFGFTLKGGIVHSSRIVHGSRIGNRVRDTSVCKRVIKDGYDGPGFIVMGEVIVRVR